MKAALITGIAGQDGSYLAEYLVARGYEVHGVVRSSALDAPGGGLPRIAHLRDRLKLYASDLDDYEEVLRVVEQASFDECYHLAARSFVAVDAEEASAALDGNVRGTCLLLLALHEVQPDCRFCFAGSSEMFGRPEVIPQDESTRFHPRSLYGISKVTGHWLTVQAREGHGMHACSAILFNHTSPRANPVFLPRKVTMGVARIHLGVQRELPLGDLEARRDWGHARDYIRAMHAMLQLDAPDDFVVGTGRVASVRELCRIAFEEVGLDYRDHVRTDDRFVRPPETSVLQANPARAREVLGWCLEHTLEDVVQEMVRADIQGMQEVESSKPTPIGRAE